MKKYIKLIVICGICLIILSGCNNSKKVSLNDKNLAELDYIEGNIVKILNKYSNNEYIEKLNQEEIGNESDNSLTITEIEIFKWDKLQEDTKKIEDVLATTMADLTALNVEAGEIEKLSNGINNLTKAIENKDSVQYLTELSNIYSLIPTYLERNLAHNEKTFKIKIKYNVISAYISYLNNDIESSKIKLDELEKSYTDKMKEITYVQENEYNLNKIYILIQEFRRAIESESNELVKSKYMYLIKEI